MIDVTILAHSESPQASVDEKNMYPSTLKAKAKAYTTTERNIKTPA